MRLPLVFAFLILVFHASPSAAALKVVCTLPVFRDAVTAIGGDQVEAVSIGKERQDPHFVEPTPWGVARLSRADLFVHAGLDLELWRGPLLEAASNPKVFAGTRGNLDLSTGVELLQIPVGNVNRQMGDVHLMGNPHYWYAPPLMVRVAQAIEDALVGIDPAGEPGYRARGRAYRSEIEAAIEGWGRALAPYRGTPIVAFHNSFPYFEAWSGLTILDFVEPKPGVTPSAGHLARLAMAMKKAGVKVVLTEPFYNVRIAQDVARVTGTTLVTFWSQTGEAGRRSYREMMQQNLDAILAALGGNGP